MANPEHLEVVKKGYEAIDKWRVRNPEIVLDLREADLSGADLSRAYLPAAHLMEADLSGAYLYDANLSGADLREADLRGVDLNVADLSDGNLREVSLYGCNLNRADLQRANLSGAILLWNDLFEADLAEADLSGATLIFTNMSGARLDNSSFENVILAGTTFAFLDLSAVRGLQTIQHGGPSSIGIETLFQSKGKIPEVFLRGCGVPEVLIEYLPNLIGAMEPIQFYSCFISYSGKDDAFARRVHSRFKAEKLQLFFSPEDMRGGRKSEQQIDEAIRKNDRLLLVLSENSMKSEWVRREIKKARKKEKDTGKNVLFPIALVPIKDIKAWEYLDSDSGEDLAEKVREYHIPDFSKWKDEDEFEKAFATLMRDLRRQDDRKADGPGRAG